jgi:hypothetical protein
MFLAFLLSCFSFLLFVICSPRLLPYLLGALNCSCFFFSFYIISLSVAPSLSLLSTSPYPRPLNRSFLLPTTTLRVYFVSFPTRNTSRNPPARLCYFCLSPALPGQTTHRETLGTPGHTITLPFPASLPRSCYNLNLIPSLSRSGMCLGPRLPYDYPSNQ